MAITIFTGAGASNPFDYPTTIEFFPPKEQLERHYHDVFNKLVQHFGSHKLDVEDVLGLLEPAEDFLKSSPGSFVLQKLTDNWSTKINQFTQYVRERCFDLYGQLPEEKKVSDIYEPLLNMLGWQKNRISLFTVNYDPITDIIMDIAEEKDIPAYDGFKPRGKWDTSGYRKNKTGIDIFRLHGSMSWIQNENHIINTRDYSHRSVSNIKHLIVYPGYKGNPQDEANEVFTYPHEALIEDLKNTEVLIVIGFSFRDAHLNKVFQQSFKANKALKLILVNPVWPTSDKEILDKLKAKYRNRVLHIDDNFGNHSTISKLKKYIKTG